MKRSDLAIRVILPIRPDKTVMGARKVRFIEYSIEVIFTELYFPLSLQIATIIPRLKNLSPLSQHTDITYNDFSTTSAGKLVIRDALERGANFDLQ